ncbi:MAG: hypothetical protein H6733_14915 [Alphaproteobacteria bacterium]|nr:hypothetical protein [Alphaproteobacteria bacterium]
MRTIWTVALLAACAGSTTDKVTDTDTDTDVDTDTGVVDTDATCELAPDPSLPDCSADVPSGGAGLTGALVDVDGNPLNTDAALRVQYCRGDTCLIPDCTFSNTYAFGNLDAGPGSFDIVLLPSCDGERFATPFAPLDVETGVTRTVDVTVPRLGPATAIPATATEIEVVDGLYLTVGEGSLERPSPLEPAATEIAGVDATDVAVPIEGITGTVLAVYYLAPFDYDSSAGVPVRLDNAWTLADSEGELWIGDYTTSSWEKVGDLTIDGDDKLTTATGLPRMSTLVVVRKPSA